MVHLLNSWNSQKRRLLAVLIITVICFGFGFRYGWKARSNYLAWRSTLPWYVRWIAPELHEKPARKPKPATKAKAVTKSEVIPSVPGCIDTEIRPSNEVRRSTKTSRLSSIDRADFERPKRMR